MKPERLAREVVYQSRWVNLYKDTVKFPNGFVIDKYHLLDFEHEAVVALMENAAGEVIFASFRATLAARFNGNCPQAAWKLMKKFWKLPNVNYWKKLVIALPITN